MNFITPFQDKEKVWVRGTQRIAQHYLKTWFAIDMVSVFPFDIVDEFSSQRCATPMSRALDVLITAL